MKRWCLMALGWLAFATGILGIVLPLLPTTPFMLLAAALFARSSPRFHRWLLAHPWFGPPIEDWLLVVPLPWVRLLLVVIMVILLTWLMRVPVLEPVAMKK